MIVIIPSHENTKAVVRETLAKNPQLLFRVCSFQLYKKGILSCQGKVMSSEPHPAVQARLEEYTADVGADLWVLPGDGIAGGLAKKELYSLCDMDGVLRYGSLQSLLPIHREAGEYIVTPGGYSLLTQEDVDAHIAMLELNHTKRVEVTTALEQVAELQAKAAASGIDLDLADIEKAVKPDHYRQYLDTGDGHPLQWLETMQYLPMYRDNPEVFEGAVMLFIRKYLDRYGSKDAKLQELKKAMWYLDFLIKRLETGKPVKL